MKTISSLVVAMCMLISSVEAGSNKSVPVDPRVLKAFSLTFPSVINAKWYEDVSGYTVAFTAQESSVIAIYDKQGELIKVRRTYSKDQLSLPLQIRIQKKYPGKLISGITEVTSGEEIVYEITLKDETHWYKVISDNTGSMQLIQKFRRAE